MTDPTDIYIPPGWTYEERRKFLDDWHAQSLERAREAEEAGVKPWLDDDTPLIGGVKPD